MNHDVPTITKPRTKTLPKATRATEAGRQQGYPLQFTTEPEE